MTNAAADGQTLEDVRERIGLPPQLMTPEGEPLTRAYIVANRTLEDQGSDSRTMARLFPEIVPQRGSPEYKNWIVHRMRLYHDKDSHILQSANGVLMRPQAFDVDDNELMELVIEEYEREHNIDLPD